jgi:hypothetical protein
MINWTDFTVKEEQRQDLLRQAEKQRLIRQALAGRRQYRQLFSFVLAWLIQ